MWRKIINNQSCVCINSQWFDENTAAKGFYRHYLTGEDLKDSLFL